MDSKSSFAKASIDKSDSTQAESANKNDGQVSSKEQIAEAVREIHKTAKASGGVDPKIFENSNFWLFCFFYISNYLSINIESFCCISGSFY